MIRIGEIIKVKRKELDMTQEELSGILGVSKAAISKWENADCYPDITILPKIAKTFHISIDELFDYTHENKESEVVCQYNFGFSLDDIDIAIFDHGTISKLEKSLQSDSNWAIRVHFISTEENIPYTIQKYIKPNALIDGYSVRFVDGKPVMDKKPNKHYICKEKVWEYHNKDRKYVKQMIQEQVAMGLIEDAY